MIIMSKNIPGGKNPKLFKKFIKFMYKGIVHGAKKYGDHSYINRDMIEMAKEEIRDLVNYGYFLWIKLNALRNNLLSTLIEVVKWDTIISDEVKKTKKDIVLKKTNIKLTKELYKKLNKPKKAKVYIKKNAILIEKDTVDE